MIAVRVLTSTDDAVLGGSAATSDAEIVAQSASASGIEDGSENSNMLAQVFPICIHNIAILYGDVIDINVRHTPFLLLILTDATLDAASANANTTMTGYVIVSSSSSQSSSLLSS